MYAHEHSASVTVECGCEKQLICTVKISALKVEEGECKNEKVIKKGKEMIWEHNYLDRKRGDMGTYLDKKGSDMRTYLDKKRDS